MRHIILFNFIVILILIVVISILYKKVMNNKATKRGTNGSIKYLPINVPTRGEKLNYEEVGVISNGDKLFKLMGRQIYSGSSKWQYYALSDQYNSVRLTVINKKGRECDTSQGCEELFDGDLLTVPDVDKNLKFNVNMHNKNVLSYIPFV